MNGSSTFRNAGAASWWSGIAGRAFPRLLSIAVVSVCLSVSMRALDPERAMTQYLRDEWGVDRGYPGGPVHALAQTADGYLWVAADKGLVRFDGLTFRLFEPSGLAAGIGPSVLGLATDATGTLWARLRGPSLMRWRDGSLESVSVDGAVDAVITAMARAQDGGLLLAPLGRDVVELREGRGDAMPSRGTVPRSFVMAMAQTADGDIWLGTRDSGLIRLDGRRATQVSDGLPDSKINCLLAAPDGSLWIGTDRGVVRWSDGAVTTSGVPAALADVPALAIIRDRQANVWVAGGGRGLLRVTAEEVSVLDAGQSGDRPSVSSVFEDREGNIWAGSSRGLVRLRDTVFTTWSTRQGLPSDAVGPVYVDSAQRTWLAPADRGLYWLRGGEMHAITGAGLAADVVYSIDGVGDDVWVGRQQGGLTRIRLGARGTAIDRFTQADGLAQNNVYSVRVARDGSVWAGTLSGGVSHLKDGVFHNVTVADGLPSNTIAAILESAAGDIWLGTPNGLSTRSNGRWRVLRTGDGLPSNDVNALMEDASGAIWVGTASGLAVVRDGRAQSLAAANPRLHAPILGLAEDASGWFWIATTDGVYRVARRALESGRLGDGDIRSFGTADGLLSVEGVKRQASLAADPRGRVWLATTRGLAMADPARADAHAPPALVRIEGVSADGETIAVGSTVGVPAGRQRVTIDYAGLSLAVPERVRFRYRLDGFDRVWSAPVEAREAVYTNLGPGHYTFRVKASNGYGAWPDDEAVLGFDVAPTAWQTSWFRLSAALLCVAAAWAAYRLRLLQVARRMNERFDERLAERTRIAQELHDTLLQGFLSASMQLHVAADSLPAESPSKAAVGRVQELMARVIDEGRHAVRGLRATVANAYDLERAFAGIPAELPAGGNPEYHVIVQGRPRPLAPVIRDDVYRIGREAVVNAFRHAAAGRVDLEIVFAPRELQVIVRDDGRGIDPGVVRSGTDGHWGLPGMRERAGRIGAQFKVSTRAGSGTEVALVVPGQVAFADETVRRGGWASRFRRPAGGGNAERRSDDGTEAQP